MRKRLLNIVAGVILIGTFILATKDTASKKIIYKTLYDKVSNLIDVDGLDGTSIEEWKPVYKKLEKPYNELTSNPKIDFSRDDLRKYLESVEEAKKVVKKRF